ncbi:hypothetical protein [Acinetobacter phage Ab65]|uniref:Uncharacterized protein n=1 Tax=Acinetobacter phage P919 TaxID=3229763 RepID=A0AB39AII1_9CAUD|nr:hypothetical protein [Acinetobacter phage P1068]WMC00243.1 hypothetical protein [Acinetobacter phage Ab31]WMC00542.1 hypothetical protein [Acinetobacter phage Ab59]WMC00613.1 hypothetical protein [Acinetobacter phage Ab65]
MLLEPTLRLKSEIIVKHISVASYPDLTQSKLCLARHF